MNASLAALAYLVSGVLFILSLRGLSSPETSRQGNTFGMIGMALAIGVTLLTLAATRALDPLTLGLIAVMSPFEPVARYTYVVYPTLCFLAACALIPVAARAPAWVTRRASRIRRITRIVTPIATCS